MTTQENGASNLDNIMWRDVTGYERWESPMWRTPRAWELGTTGIFVTRKGHGTRKGIGSRWFLKSRKDGINNHNLGTNLIEEAKAKALEFIKNTRLK